MQDRLKTCWNSSTTTALRTLHSGAEAIGSNWGLLQGILLLTMTKNLEDEIGQSTPTRMIAGAFFSLAILGYSLYNYGERMAAAARERELKETKEELKETKEKVNHLERDMEMIKKTLGIVPDKEATVLTVDPAKTNPATLDVEAKSNSDSNVPLLPPQSTLPRSTM